MARYLPMLRIAISHEYCAGLPLHLRFVPGKECAALMLREGMAVVYTAGGSEYGSWGLDKLKAYEHEAKCARTGPGSQRAARADGQTE